MTDMGEEMKGYIIGPMFATQFLNKFFPKKSIRSTSKAKVFKQGLFSGVVSRSSETEAYKPFVGRPLIITLCDY